MKQKSPVFESLTSKAKLAVAELENALGVFEKFMVKFPAAVWNCNTRGIHTRRQRKGDHPKWYIFTAILDIFYCQKERLQRERGERERDLCMRTVNFSLPLSGMLASTGSSERNWERVVPANGVTNSESKYEMQ